MPLLSDEVREQLRTIFTNELRDEVTLAYYTRSASKLIVPGRQQEDCEYCELTQQLYEELTDLTDKLKLEVHDITQEPSDVRENEVPLTVLRGHNEGTLRYFGIPADHEFSTLLGDIVDLSTGDPALSSKTKEALAGLEQDLHIQVFVTPT